VFSAKIGVVGITKIRINIPTNIFFILSLQDRTRWWYKNL